MSAVLDGEIVCLEPDGRSNFYKLLFRTGLAGLRGVRPVAVDGEDLRNRPLLERKRRLKALVPRMDSRLLYMDHVRERGKALFDAACARDLEGIVGKWARGRYEADGVSTFWVKVKNPAYSQMVGRREVFDATPGPASTVAGGLAGASAAIDWCVLTGSSLAGLTCEDTHLAAWAAMRPSRTYC
jgi:hypothetical protein